MDFSQYSDDELRRMAGLDAPPPESTNFQRFVTDPLVTATKGAIGWPEALTGLADIPTLGYAGKAVRGLGVDFKGAKDELDKMYSPAQQEANRLVREAKGFIPTVSTMLENPSTILHQAGESIPSMLGGGLIGRGVLAALPKIGPAIAGGMGEGAISAGSMAEQIRQDSKEGTLTPAQAGISALTGAVTGAIGATSGTIAKKLGIMDVDTAIAGGKLSAAIDPSAQKGALRRIVESGFMEGPLEELPQSFQEHVGQNLATGRPAFEGAPEAGAMGMLTGAAMGMAGGAGAHVMAGKETAQPPVVPTVPVAAAPVIPEISIPLIDPAAPALLHTDPVTSTPVPFADEATALSTLKTHDADISTPVWSDTHEAKPIDPADPSKGYGVFWKPEAAEMQNKALEVMAAHKAANPDYAEDHAIGLKAMQDLGLLSGVQFGTQGTELEGKVTSLDPAVPETRDWIKENYNKTEKEISAYEAKETAAGRKPLYHYDGAYVHSPVAGERRVALFDGHTAQTFRHEVGHLASQSGRIPVPAHWTGTEYVKEERNAEEIRQAIESGKLPELVAARKAEVDKTKAAYAAAHPQTGFADVFLGPQAEAKVSVKAATEYASSDIGKIIGKLENMKSAQVQMENLAIAVGNGGYRGKQKELFAEVDKIRKATKNEVTSSDLNKIQTVLAKQANIPSVAKMTTNPVLAEDLARTNTGVGIVGVPGRPLAVPVGEPKTTKVVVPVPVPKKSADAITLKPHEGVVTKGETIPINREVSGLLPAPVKVMGFSKDEAKAEKAMLAHAKKNKINQATLEVVPVTRGKVSGYGYRKVGSDAHYSVVETKAIAKEVSKATKDHASWAELAPLLKKSGMSDEQIEAKSTVQRNNLLKAFDNTPDEDYLASVAKAGEVGKNWYTRAAASLVDMFGPDANVMARLIAAYSPNKNVLENLSLAFRAFALYKSLGPHPTKDQISAALTEMKGDTQGNIDNAVRALTGESLGKDDGAFKIKNFALNLMNITDAVTLDVWMSMISGNYSTNWGDYASKSFITASAPQYAAYAAKVAKVADKLGWTPSEVQAAIWTMGKALYEKMGQKGEGGYYLKYRGTARTGQEALDELTLRDLSEASDLSNIILEDMKRYGKLSEALRKLGITRKSFKTVKPLHANASEKITQGMGETSRGHLGRLAGTLETIRQDRDAESALAEETRKKVDTVNANISPISSPAKVAARMAAGDKVKAARDQKILDMDAKIAAVAATQPKVAAQMRKRMLQPSIDWLTKEMGKIPGVADFSARVAAGRFKGGQESTLVLNAKVSEEALPAWKEVLARYGKEHDQDAVYTTNTVDIAGSIEKPAPGIDAQQHPTVLYSFKSPLTEGDLIAISNLMDDVGLGGSTYYPDTNKLELKHIQAFDATKKEFADKISAFIKGLRKISDVAYYERFWDQHDAIWKDDYADTIREGRSSRTGKAVPRVNGRYSTGNAGAVGATPGGKTGPGDAGNIQRKEQEAPQYNDSRGDAKGNFSIQESKSRGQDVPGVREGSPGTDKQYTTPYEPVSAVGVHFSQERRDSLDSSKYGTGLSGEERTRMPADKNSPLRHRIHFYIFGNQNEMYSEAGVGSHQHRVQLDNLYDPSSGELDYRVKPGENAANAFEMALINAGYDGYINRSMGMAVLLGQRNVPVEYKGQTANMSDVPRMAPIKITREMKLQDILANSNDVPQGSISGPRWVQEIKDEHPDIYPELEAMGIIGALEKYKGTLNRREVMGVVALGKLKNPAMHYSIREVYRNYDMPTGEGVSATKLPRKGTNSEIKQRSATEMLKWPKFVTDPEGKKILLWNPERNPSITRQQHLTNDESHGYRDLDMKKVEWLPNIPATIQNADVKLIDKKTRNVLYVRAYENGEKHIVIVDPKGVLREHGLYDAGLITHYKEERETAISNFPVSWPTKGISNGKIQNSPFELPAGSKLSGTTQQAYDGDTITGSEKIVKEKITNYSIRETDAAYMKAVEDNDLDTAQKMVDEAAESTKHLVHVTPSENVDKILKSGIRLGKPTDMEDVPGVYLFNNKLDAEDAIMNWLGDRYDEDIELSLVYVDPRGVTDTYTDEAAGYEVISKKPVSAEHARSSAPVVYDDNGNVIPLSKRFKTSINYSLGETKLAPNGKPSNLSDTLWNTVRTPEFKKWFGDSKVVDENGEPLVVYHGTGADFNSYIGHAFFTPSTKDAKQYGKKIMPVFLKLENPKVIDYEFTDDNVGPNGWGTEYDVDEAKTEGHDGVIFKNIVSGFKGEKSFTQYVAFDPTQIKSATGNIGTFDPNNPDIRYSLGESKPLVYKKLYTKGGGGLVTVLNGMDVTIEKQYGSGTWVAQSVNGEIDIERETLAAIKNNLEQLRDDNINYSLGETKSLPALTPQNLSKPLPKSATPAQTQEHLQLQQAGILKGILPLARAYINSFSKTGQEMSMFEKIVSSPEFWQHPVLQQLYKSFVTNREGYYHSDFFDLTTDPIGNSGERTDVVKATSDLKKQSPKEYKDLEDVIDYGDTKWARSGIRKGETEQEHLARNIKEFKDAIQKKFNPSERTMKVWELHRKLYDKALDKMMANMRALADSVGDSEQPQTIKAKLEKQMAEMNTWKGFYAPRQREMGDFFVMGYKDENGPNMQIERWHGDRLAMIKKDAEMKAAGWDTKGGMKRISRLPESLYGDISMLDVGQLLSHSLDKLDANKDTDTRKSIEKLNLDILQAVSDTLKARAFRSTMISRNKEHTIKGYVTDPQTRLIRYANNVAGGLSKARVAKEAYEAFLGKINPDTGKREGGLKPAENPRVYEVGKEYIKEQMRNLDATDRAIGLAKSVATFMFLGFNPRSAIVNMTAMLTTVPPAIRAFALGGKGSFMKINQALAKAAKDYGDVMRGKRLSDPHEQAFMDYLQKMHMDNPQYTRDAMGELQSNASNWWSKAMTASMWAFGKTEQWNRGTTMLAAFRLAKDQGQEIKIDENGDISGQAVESAVEASNHAHGVYSRGTLPIWAQGTNPTAKIGQMVYTYSKFGHTYMQNLYDMGVRKKDMPSLIYMMAAPIVLGGAGAIPFGEEMKGLINILLKMIGVQEPMEKWVWKQTRKQLGPDAERVLRYGTSGALGMDINGSIGIGVGVPTGFMDLTGAIGGAAKNIYTAGHFLNTEQYSKAAEKVLPPIVGNALKAYRESTTGVTTEVGNRVFDAKGKPYKLDPGEAALRFAGVQSSEVSRRKAMEFEAKTEEANWKGKRDKIYEVARAFYASPQRDPKEYTSLLARVAKYNAAWTDAGMRGSPVPMIKMSQLKEQAQHMAKQTNIQKKRDLAANR